MQRRTNGHNRGSGDPKSGTKLALAQRRCARRRVCLQTDRAAHRDRPTAYRAVRSSRFARVVGRLARWCTSPQPTSIQTLIAVQQPVDRRVIERPGARCIEAPRGRPHGTRQSSTPPMRDPHDGASSVFVGQPLGHRDATFVERRSGFRHLRVRTRGPARRQRRVSSGQCRAMSAYVKPSKIPKQRSRSPRSRCTPALSLGPEAMRYPSRATNRLPRWRRSARVPAPAPVVAPAIGPAHRAPCRVGPACAFRHSRPFARGGSR